MRYTISGEFLDGDNFNGEWLGVDADNLDVSNANQAEVLDFISGVIRQGGNCMLEDAQENKSVFFPENIRRLTVALTS